MDKQGRSRIGPRSPRARPPSGTWRWLRLALPLLLALQLLGLSGLAVGAIPGPTIEVTTTNDVVDAGDCGTIAIGDLPGTDTVTSLREALCVANNSADDETITFAPAVTGTITLTSGALSIFRGVTITGPGAATLTISGNNASGVFNINDGGMVAISGLTIGNGSAGGGGGLFTNNSTVTLTNVVVSGNRAGVFGGGLYLDTGSLTLVSSTVSRNSAGSRGGGIFNSAGTLDLQGTTVQENTSDDATGGIYNYNGTLLITNSAVQRNSAPNGIGGISNVLGSATIAASFVDGNTTTGPGGGIGNSGTLALNSSTVSNNVASGDGGGLYNTGTLTGDRAAFYNNQSGGNGGGIYNTGSLTLAGGSITLSQAVGDGGGLDNHAGTVSLTGVTLEYNAAGIAAGRVTPAQLSGQGGAIFSTTLVPTGLANGTPVVALSLNNATVANNHASEGGGIAIESGTASIQNSTITANESATIGGGVASLGQLAILTSTIGLNHAGSSGGGIFTNGPLSVSGSTVEGNSADQGGGGIEIYGNTVAVLGSTINGNTAVERGGGINNISGSLTAANTTISGNRTDGPGGGIASNTCATTLTFVTITGNHADYDGTGAVGDGGLYFQQPEFGVACVAMTMESSIVAGNHDDSTTVMFTADCVGPLVSTGNNVFMEGGGCPISPDDATYTTGFDTVLDLTLADNGGPTKTHALPPGSIAIDFGDATACAASPVNAQDQRGTIRPQGSGCDSGAYEFTEESPLVTLTITVTGQ